MTPLEAIRKIESAISPAIFGDDKEATYKRLLSLVHPDRFTGEDRLRADEAARKLGELYSRVGKNLPASRIGNFTIEVGLCAGDIADLYVSGTSILKVVRDESDNDLMEAERASLHKLGGHYFPKLSGELKIGQKCVNIFHYDARLISLSSVKSLVPELSFRHIIWIGNRILQALGLAQRERIVHGAVTPDHILIEPTTHGMLLVGWGSSVPNDKPIPVMARSWKAIYPEEVSRKWNAHPATDIYMAMQSLKWASSEIPKRFKPLFEHCFAGSPNARPVDAWELQNRWKQLAEEEYGKPSFVKLEVPIQ